MSVNSTYVVHVTVKMDAHTERQAVTDALDAIESALSSHLGGERNSWHPYETNNGHAVRCISVEGANIAGTKKIQSLDEKLADLRETLISLEEEAYEGDHTQAEDYISQARVACARARRVIAGTL